MGLVSVALLLASCGGSDDRALGGEAGGTLPAPHPLSVVAYLDGSVASAARIGPDGGTVSLVVPGGGRYVLELPPGALLAEEDVAMSLITGIDGLPAMGGLLGGVAIEPEGLRLMEPATLTLEGVEAPPTGMERLAFGYRGAGTEFHLVPHEVANDAVALTLWHFSGYGLAAGTASDVAAQREAHPPTAPDDWADQEVAADPSAANRHAALLAYGMSIYGMAASAEGSLQELLSVAMLYTSWKLQAVSDPSLGYVDDLIGLALARATESRMTELWLTCGSAADPAVAVEMIRLERWSYLKLAKWVPIGTYAQKVKACARFELDLDSTIVGGVDSGGILTVQVRGTVPIEPIVTDPVLLYMGSAPLRHAALKVSVDQDCTGSISGRDGAAMVTDLEFPIDFVASTATVVAPPLPMWLGAELVYDPGMPEETFTISCPDVGDLTMTVPYWAGVYAGFHQDELDDASGGYRVRSWAPGAAGPSSAERHYFRTDADQQSEDTTLTLRYAPAR